MNQAKLIQFQVQDLQFNNLHLDNNQNLTKRKSLKINFTSARIFQVVIKINQRLKNIEAYLTNLQNQSTQKKYQNVEYIKFNFFTMENQKLIYCSQIDTNNFYNCLYIKIEQDEIGFYNIQLYGQEANKLQQTTLDNFQLKPSQIEIENGTSRYSPENLTSYLFDRENNYQNKYSSIQKKEFKIAQENSLISAQYEEMIQRQFQESIKNSNSLYKEQDELFQEELSIDFINEDQFQQSYQNGQKNEQQIIIEDLGYKDSNDRSNNGDYKQIDEMYGKQNNQQVVKSDPIKLHLMKKYHAGDINHNFMQIHRLMEQTGGVRRFLENVMYN